MSRVRVVRVSSAVMGVLCMMHAPVATPLAAQSATAARAVDARSVVASDDPLTSAFEVDGIPVVLRRVTANNVVAANVYLLGGVRQLTSQTQGLELLLLEATEEGTAKYARDDLRRRMARLGSTVGVGPGVDWSTMSLRSTVANFDSSWVLMADRLVAPRLDSSSVALVRTRILSAVRQRAESPDALLDYLADSSAFAGHPYGLSPVGTEASLQAITTDMLRRYHTDQIVRSRIRVVIVGNVTRDRVERLVRSTLGTLPQGNYAWTLPQPPESRASGATFLMRRLPTNYIQGWFVGPSADSPDHAALRLASAVLGGRLFAEVRERLNLTYAIDAPFRERAFAVGGLYVTTTQPDVVLGIMQREMRALQQGTISDDGLERLVQQFIVTYYLDNETNADQANLLARAALYQGDYRRANTFVDDLRAVTPEDIRLAAVRYFRDVRFAFIGDALRVDRRLFERF